MILHVMARAGNAIKLTAMKVKSRKLLYYISYGTYKHLVPHEAPPVVVPCKGAHSLPQAAYDHGHEGSSKNESLLEY